MVPDHASLQDVLLQWCEDAGWTLLWNSEYSYPIRTDRFTGSFIQAVDALFGSMRGVTPGVRPVLYINSQTVVVVNDASME
ncbi:TcpQ domain-containing protein (plasmid) [Paraburkholderia sp. DD10]|uniref:TcpQ domain-containing protein n=1 Tax=Paraburkholderia sp. DD10 TaxID=3409691 RepID=UPI003BA12919